MVDVNHQLPKVIHNWCFPRLGKQEQCNVVLWWPSAQTSRKDMQCDGCELVVMLVPVGIGKPKIVKQKDVMKGNIMWQDAMVCNRSKNHAKTTGILPWFLNPATTTCDLVLCITITLTTEVWGKPGTGKTTLLRRLVLESLVSSAQGGRAGSFVNHFW